MVHVGYGSFANYRKSLPYNIPVLSMVAQWSPITDYILGSDPHFLKYIWLPCLYLVKRSSYPPLYMGYVTLIHFRAQ